MNKPTDAEIIALADETRTGEPGREGYILPISFARAVLAKWGTQQPVEREHLTDEQIKDLQDDGVFLGTCRQIVRAIEAAHGIKGPACA